MEAVGRYRIVGRLGEGGMGVVYEAHDDRLDRVVALKLMREAMHGPAAVERFWREARAAAAISHPNICQIFELGDEAGRPFIVMERLTGESLADRLTRGPLPARDAAAVALGLLDALEALHQRQVVHRDLKPSNVFLTAHGVKLLDFGLARDVGLSDATTTRLTNPGLLVGTPHYMAPEQVTAGDLDARADLFAAGAILFEMLSGHAAYRGATAVDVLQQVLHEQPPALLGSPLVTALDAVIHRAMAKKPDARYPSAGEMAADVRHALVLDDSGEAARVTTMTRLVVLPFRLLRPDPDTEFLAFSLPDAITATLSAHASISVRSPLAASRFASEAPDLQALAETLDVDHVLTGTVLRSGDQLRISVQLVRAPGGSVIWSHSAQTALGELFELHDQLTDGIVEALPVARPAAPAAVDVPRTPRAYELYLRANQFSLESSTYRLALSLYERCLEEDPNFAPAWARLGRVHRVIGKYLEMDAHASYAAAEHAFQRALALNPDLPLAHNLYSYLETELGRAEQAMTGALDRLRRSPNSPELLAALVHSCRYCGLLDASVAAHERARRLDPQIRTSVLHTYFALGDYARCVEESQWLTDPMLSAALISMGRTEEARAAMRVESERFAGNTIERHFIAHLSAFVGGSREDGVRELDGFMHSGFKDGEGIYHGVRGYARLGEIERAVAGFAAVVENGFCCYPLFTLDAWLDPLRAHPTFVKLLRQAESRHRAAQRLFSERGGERLLGMRS